MAPSQQSASPSFSPTSSSFDMVSSLTSADSARSFQWASEEIDTDEIVYSPGGSSPAVSDEADSHSDSDPDADDLSREDTRDNVSIATSDDFVLLSRSQSPVIFAPASTISSLSSDAGKTEDLVSSLADLSLRESHGSAHVSGKTPNGRQVPICRTVDVNKAATIDNEARIVVKPAPAGQSSSARKPRARKQAVSAPVHTRTSGSLSDTSSESTTPPGTPQQHPHSLSVGTPSAKTTSPHPPVDPAKPKRRRRRAKKNAATTPKPANRALPQSDAEGDDTDYTSMYHEAVTFITSYITNPPEIKESSCLLTLLQSLIIELGLAPNSLPKSLTSAKALLKSKAFLNIKEYLAIRNKGQSAIQQAMYPSRSALVKSIRKNKSFASKKWVKQHGLDVLLVSCYH